MDEKERRLWEGVLMGLEKNLHCTSCPFKDKCDAKEKNRYCYDVLVEKWKEAANEF